MPSSPIRTRIALVAAALVAGATAAQAQAAQGVQPAVRAAMPNAATPNAPDTTRAAKAKGVPAVPAAKSEQPITLVREVFAYDAEGRRDPFASLLSSSELRPMVSDLKLAVVLYDPTGGSRAVLRDLSTKGQYSVHVGQTLGRMRVARITPKAVTFTILEFGESRQETLALSDSTTSPTKTRTP